jgi:aspartate dehydrogenase
LAIRIAIVGLGTIGRAVARKLADGLPGVALSAVAVRDRAKAEHWLAGEGIDCRCVEIADLPDYADLAIECGPAAIVADVCTSMLRAGRQVMVLSASALLPRMDLVDLARETGGRIIVPTGALLGLDAVAAAAEGTIESVRIATRKPPGGLQGAPYLVENRIVVDDLVEAKCVFRGPARAAAVAFPANVNVVAALALAGIGPDRTMVEVWADPAAIRNCHEIQVVSASANFSMRIENIPTDNPKTGRITSLSVIAALRKLTSPLVVGS